MKEFKEEELTTIKIPSYDAMDDRMLDIITGEIKALGLANSYGEKITVSSVDECYCEPEPGWMYLLNEGLSTTRINFGYDAYEDKFILKELLVDIPNLKLSVNHYYENDLFYLQSIGFFKPIVKIWFNSDPDNYHDLLLELDNVNLTSVWKQPELKKPSDYPLPLFPVDCCNDKDPKKGKLEINNYDDLPY